MSYLGSVHSSEPLILRSNGYCVKYEFKSLKRANANLFILFPIQKLPLFKKIPGVNPPKAIVKLKNTLLLLQTHLKNLISLHFLH